MEPAAALTRFEAMLALDSSDVAANWRAAIALNDLAELTAANERPRRDSLLARAQQHARRAVRLAPEDARAQFALGLVLGNTALTRGLKQRVRLSVEIREVALRAIGLDSTLDGPHHLLGRWHQEVMKLSSLERFIARSLLGGGAFRQASWWEAQRQLELAVALDPSRIYHRLDLARVYLARKDTVAALIQLRTIDRLPDQVAADSRYRRTAGELLAQLDR
jgi:tetratricopeptide (TPR) repeat protein